jgi:hypothetical protein
MSNLSIPTDLVELWKFLADQKDPFPVEPEDMKNFVLRIAKAEEDLKLEKQVHKITLRDLQTAEEQISTTCKKWLAVIDKKKA